MTAPTFHVANADCRDYLRTLPDCSVDAVVCDPPYELGFMGKAWDSTGIAYDVTVWAECLRVLKPGGHLIAFGGSRTYHRLACAVEDAGFVIRDQVLWLYGSGFPKALDVGKAIDNAAGAKREVLGTRTAHDIRNNNLMEASQGLGRGTMEYEFTAPATPEAQQWDGWKSALKPAHEPAVLARKPFPGTVAANVLAHGTGALNIGACRIESTESTIRVSGDAPKTRGVYGEFESDAASGFVTGANEGRYPANLIHDGSPEVWNVLGEQSRYFYTSKASAEDRDEGLKGFEQCANAGVGALRDNGRGKTARNAHPTVKPCDLMRYLCRLITPPGGTVLDPFTGSGSTGKAAMLEGFNFLGSELSPEYAEIARERIRHAQWQYVESRRQLSLFA